MGQAQSIYQDSNEPVDGAACLQLAISYSTGKGVPFDLVAAHKWFNVAAVKGEREALGWRAELAQEMTTAQIAEAQRLAREWLLSRA
ncbi:MAG: SEL1-like repeat protein [Alphaproteobacteria bacterium]|nr:SEL1-like repeat protein [Alphaproteobacteria bacterium]